MASIYYGHHMGDENVRVKVTSEDWKELRALGKRLEAEIEARTETETKQSEQAETDDLVRWHVLDGRFTDLQRCLGLLIGLLPEAEWQQVTGKVDDLLLDVLIRCAEELARPSSERAQAQAQAPDEGSLPW